jgi:hypothetical protein
MRLRYEDFVAHPPESLREIGEFVEEEFDPHHLFTNGRVSVQPTHSAWGNPNRFESGAIPVAPDTTWMSAMSTWRQVVVTAMTYPLMRRYGYPLPKCRPPDPCSRRGR